MSRVRVTVTRTAGSAPREAGAAMEVWEDRIAGTIGGGRLEWEAIAIARSMLGGEAGPVERSFPLGPALGQCCGGSVTLSFDPDPGAEAGPDGAPLWVWGAGHVGRAIVATLAPLPEFQITWADDAADRFPQGFEGVDRLVAADMPRAAAHAPTGAHHLIVTYSHEIDLALCHALLTRGFATCGLIGSATKWARFRSRLAALGHGPEAISRIACPIGDPSLGKHPQAIAVGVAAALLSPGDKVARGTRAG